MQINTVWQRSSSSIRNYTHVFTCHGRTNIYTVCVVHTCTLQWSRTSTNLRKQNINNFGVFQPHLIFRYSLPHMEAAGIPEQRTLFRFFNPVGVNPLTEKNHLPLCLLPRPFRMPLCNPIIPCLSSWVLYCVLSQRKGWGRGRESKTYLGEVVLGNLTCIPPLYLLIPQHWSNFPSRDSTVERIFQPQIASLHTELDSMQTEKEWQIITFRYRRKTLYQSIRKSIILFAHAIHQGTLEDREKPSIHFLCELKIAFMTSTNSHDF